MHIAALGMLLTVTAWTSAGALLPAPAADPLPAPLPPALPAVPGLNSDFLDGKDASEFLGRAEKAADSELLDGRDSTEFADAVHDHDDRYYSEQESDARFLGIAAKAADAELLDGLDAAQFLRSDASGSLQGDLAVRGALSIERSGIGVPLTVAGTRTSDFDPSTYIFLKDLDNDRLDDGLEGCTTNWGLKADQNGGFAVHQACVGDRLFIRYDGNVGIGVESPTAALDVQGVIRARSGLKIGDVAEPVLGQGLEPGDVVVMDGFSPDGKLQVKKSDAPLSRRVVGVVSRDPSLLLAGLPGDAPLAVSGIVAVKVVGPVEEGDLLASSSVPGHAMRCEPSACGGAVLGKALEAHGPGVAVVRALVALG